MRLGNYLRVFSALSVLLLWHSPVSAADYYWTPSSGSQANNQFPSAVAACDAFAVSIKNSSGSSVYAKGQVVGTGETSRTCRGVKSDGQWLQIGYVLRRGDSCPANTEYNAAQGSCDIVADTTCEQTWSGGEIVYSEQLKQCVKYPNLPPEEFCEFMTGKDTGNTRLEAASGDASGPKSVAEPGTFCSVSVEKADCKMNTDGIYMCVVSGKYSGRYDPTADKAPGHCSTLDCETVPPEDPVPEPEVVKKDEPCVYSSSGDKQVCHSSRSEEKEGTAQCGVVNGVPTCVTKQPTKNGIDIRTEVTTETNADGSKTITKKDTAVSTNCSGVNSCTTKTATTTTTTKKDASGNTTSIGSVCSGNACPDRTTDPDADGDGLGDCATGTGKCGSGIGSEGEGGEGQDWYTPGEDTFESVLTQFAAAVKQTPIASKTTTFLTFNASGSCPSWSVSVWVFDIDIDQLCSGDIPWDAIRAVILAAAAFLAFRIALF